MGNPKITTHSFSIKDAMIHGVEKAVLLYNLRFWLEKNKVNKKNDRDGFVWTYNSAEAFALLMPYLNSRSINRWLSELETAGIIKSSNKYNKVKFDKTKWYTIPDEYSIGQSDDSTGQDDGSVSQNGESEGQTDDTIPDVNTDSKPDIPPTPQGGRATMPEPAFDSPAFREAWSDWLGHRSEIKHSLTPRAATEQMKKLAGWGEKRAIAAIRHSICNGWQGLFEEGKGGKAGAKLINTWHDPNPDMSMREAF